MSLTITKSPFSYRNTQFETSTKWTVECFAQAQVSQRHNGFHTSYGFVY